MVNNGNKDIAIIGGGIAGLTTAYELLKKGFKTTIFEKEEELGGLASSFKFGDFYLERYHHFICGEDKNLVSLLKELKIADRLVWCPVKMGLFYQNQFFPLVNVLDLFFLKPLNLLSKFHYGLGTFYASKIRRWQHLDKQRAVEWLKKTIGEKAFFLFWRPLLKNKFGEDEELASAAWVWGRIKRVGSCRKGILQKEYYGYIKGRTKFLIDKMEEEIKRGGGDIFKNIEVKEIKIEKEEAQGLIIESGFKKFDIIVSTVSLPILAKLTNSYFPEFKEIKYRAVLNVVLKLKNSLSPFFWLNIHSPDTPFVVLIEYSNLNPENKHIIYLPFYLSPDDELYSASEEEVYKKVLFCLQKINPKFKEDEIEGFSLFKDRYAQPICLANFISKIPDFKTKIKNLYLTDSTQLYPDDRTIAGSIMLAKKLSLLI